MQQISESLGTGPQVVLSIIWVLFLGYLFIDICYGIVDLIQKFIRIFNEEDPNA